MWFSVRKGSTGLHVAYRATFTNNLTGYRTRAREGPIPEIAVDLNPNLRTRNRSTGTYLDARDLADGGLQGLEVLQFADQGVVEALLSRVARARDWRLRLELEGTHTFDVRAETANSSGLFLRVMQRVGFERSVDR